MVSINAANSTARAISTDGLQAKANFTRKHSWPFTVLNGSFV